jgi:hypothetical protein
VNNMSDIVGYSFLTVANRMPEVRVDTPMHSAHMDKESLVSNIPAGDGKFSNLFYSVICEKPSVFRYCLRCQDTTVHNCLPMLV